jgi:hypothetical protein
MSFWIQHGHGKADKLDRLATEGAAGVILSANAESRESLAATVRAIRARDMNVMLDPQTYIYSVHDTQARNHPSHGLAFKFIDVGADPIEMEAQAQAVLEANVEVGLSALAIGPTVLQRDLDGPWSTMALQYGRVFVRHAHAHGIRPYMAVAVTEDALSDWGAARSWLNRVTAIDAEGIYLSVDRNATVGYPSVWQADALTNLLSICYRLARTNYIPLIVGYSDIDSLGVIAAGATAMASGWHYGQRYLRVTNFIPRGGGSVPVPKFTMRRLLSVVRANGEADLIARDPNLFESFADTSERADALSGLRTVSQAQLQHLSTLCRLVLSLESHTVASRPKEYESLLSHALRLTGPLVRSGLLARSYEASLEVQLRAARAFRAREGV